MAEVIGLLASVTTIAAVLIESVKTVRECYRASKELEALEVCSFSIVIGILSSSEESSLTPAVALRCRWSNSQFSWMVSIVKKA